MKILLPALFLLFSFSVSEAQPLVVLNKEVYQGDTLVLRLDSSLSEFEVGARMFDKIYRFNQDHLALIGVDFLQEPKTYNLDLVYLADCSDPVSSCTNYDFNISLISILKQKFPNQKWRSSKPRPKTKQRIGEEEMIARAYLSGNLILDSTQGDFLNPLSRITVTSPFGPPHRGVDLKTKFSKSKKDLGKKPVYAVNAGTVVLVAYKFSHEGNMVIIDHGRGVFSHYMHLSTFNVQEGQVVNACQIIGMSGNTGNSHGPHLHFSIKIHDSVVDPLKFIETVNGLSEIK